MNRRSVVKGLLLFTGGAMLLPSCMMEEAKASISLQHLSVSEEQEKLLAEVVDTIIPATDTPGAKEMGLHLFALKMLDDCYEAEEQQSFMKGMDAFEELTKKQTGNSFVDLSSKQKNEVIAAVNAKNAPEEVLAFYEILKNQTIKGYLNSELVMTKLRIYELVPGRYNAYFPVNKAQIS
ncbi:gluconate 2-dehydrogenase subunit 3 family protein [Pontibacter korlensis]|uniref:gluconate 2-dehydrogenase subunit 3 family protein n=1 Tax=Pontibacter korlensis TaxID=400092 RepID=UPI00061AD63B|nr:gluconate 2-dehydrogenase subunit 3 family protein [Pontibacter korlensis]